MDKKIGLVGFGYWGKILYKNLIDLGLDPIVCEPNLVDNGNLLEGKKVINKYEDLEVDKVFVAVPATAHHDIVKHFLSNGIDVFCEKPLGMYTHEVEEMYILAEKNDANLFVDWLFTFNNQVERLVELLSHSAPIRNISMNFINKGPLRYDCNAKYDLASHHISVLQTIFRRLPDSWTWINYNRDPKQKVEDSCVGFLKYGNCQVMVNASWEHEIKGREVVFTLVDGTYILWDDMTQTLKHVTDKDEQEFVGGQSSPLHNSIKTFLYVKSFSYIKQKELTRQITRILETNHG